VMGNKEQEISLQRNKNIEQKHRNSGSRQVERHLQHSDLKGLRSNASVETFIFSPASIEDFLDATSHALQRLLEATTSIC